ncbi:MAG: hypothetical protein IH618_14350 [Ignavibacteriaceae bacterium]|nr:hypothetical protein [Ignavibacteriaceae bacterium]
MYDGKMMARTIDQINNELNSPSKNLSEVGIYLYNEGFFLLRNVFAV